MHGLADLVYRVPEVRIRPASQQTTCKCKTIGGSRHYLINGTLDRARAIRSVPLRPALRALHANCSRLTLFVEVRRGLEGRPIHGALKVAVDGECR